MSTRALAAKALVQVLFERHSLSAVLRQSLSQLPPSDAAHGSGGSCASVRSPHLGILPGTSAANGTTPWMEEVESRRGQRSRMPATAKPASERALMQELCYGVLRWESRLTAILQYLMHKPLKKRDADIHSLLLLGLYQLIYMRTPDHAAVTETVAAVKVLNKAWASGLVNAVLRGYVRDARRIAAEVDRDEAAACAHPPWLLNAIKTAWPALHSDVHMPVASDILPLRTPHWPAIVTANNQHPPMTLRVNARHMDRAAYLLALQAGGIDAHAAPHTSHGITLGQPMDVERLPGFRDGWVSIQDAAAQLAAPLINAQPRQRLLDACAAPGGKTAHILELQPGIALTALDNDGQRLGRVRETLQRLRLTKHAHVLQGDAATPATWWDGIPFDNILLDAPCSATGVIRRHADIKYLRRPEDIMALAEQQARILEALWPLLRSRKDGGGMLLYVTCSILPQENQQQIIRFLANHPDAHEQPITADWGHPMTVGRQVLPGEDAMDGFYYAQLIKE